MLVSVAEHIGAPIGATQTTTLPAVSFAVTIQRTSGSATTASGETTASLTNRGGHAEVLRRRRTVGERTDGSGTGRIASRQAGQPFTPKKLPGQPCGLAANPLPLTVACASTTQWIGGLL